MSKSKDIGTKAETAVVNVLRANGFPHAERRILHGALDQGDITGTPGVAWEVKGGQQAKNASDLDIELWIGETLAERDNSDSILGVLVVQRGGVGPVNADRWWAYLTLTTVLGLHGYDAIDDGSPDVSPPVRLLLRDAIPILRSAGYGDPLEVSA